MPPTAGISPRFGLVLGAGGRVGIAYHVGVLRALHEVVGMDPADAELVIGTSAGSVVGAWVRSGYTTADMWALTHGTHPAQVGHGQGHETNIFARAWQTPFDLARRGLGGAYVLARSVVRVPEPWIPDPVRRAFPAGFLAVSSDRLDLNELLPTEWPSDPLWLCAVDIGTGKRIVLGRPGSPAATLHKGVLASCAIPGVYQPIRVGDHILIDGGVHSSTNLDLAASFEVDGEKLPVIVAIAPMAYDTRRPPPALRRLLRRIPSRALATEASLGRRGGAMVFLVRPTRRELEVHGPNPMRLMGNDAVTRAAYENTRLLLETEYGRSFAEALHASRRVA